MSGCMRSFIFLLFINLGLSSSNVPLLAWSNDPSIPSPVQNVSALTQHSFESVLARYPHIFGDNIVLFLQDELSIEDLSNHNFTNVESNMELNPSLYLPNVAHADLRHTFSQQGYKVTTLSSGSGLDEIKMVENSRNLILVELPSTSTNALRSVALRKSDEVISSFLSNVGDKKFTFIYTAKRPSVESRGDEVTHTRVSRSLKQTIGGPKLPDNFFHNQCVFIFFRNNMKISLSGKDGPFYDIPHYTSTEPIHNCEGKKQFIRLNYAEVTIAEKKFEKVKIEFNFEKERGNWYSQNIRINLDKDSNSYTPLFSSKEFNESIPVGHSYSCAEQITYREYREKNTTRNNGGLIYLKINGIQVQPFLADGDSHFGPSWDCVGFFTIGIWMGISTAVIALLILSYGMAMLADIKTMDRFDDPKGKGLMVPQAVE